MHKTGAAGKLHIVATPIGNLGDMSPRAVETLRTADIIAAEDTRTTRTLLERFSIKARLVSYHKFDEARSADYLMEELKSGKSIALVSDAGTPCISDPGHVLVRLAAEGGIEIFALPGPCALVAAASISGLDLGSFSFWGFFSREAKESKKLAEKLKGSAGTHIFYESPKRIEKTFEFFAEHFPEAKICLCNDLTKKFERVYRGGPAEVLSELKANPSAELGEYTIVLELPPPTEKSEREASPQSIESMIVDTMIKHSCGAKEAVGIIAANDSNKFSKNEIYAASLNLKKLFWG